MTQQPCKAVVLGFGGRTPDVVCSLVSRAVKECGIVTVETVRSVAMELALADAPYRIFLAHNNDTTNNNNNEVSGDNKNKKEIPVTAVTGGKKNLLLYCLPTSTTEYLTSSVSEAARVRAALLEQQQQQQHVSQKMITDTVVAIYDVQTDRVLGTAATDVHDNANGGIETVLAALLGDVRKQKSLALAALSALAELDQRAAAMVGPDPPRQDVVVLVGSGGREHALAVALAQSPLVKQVIVTPGNGGTAMEGGKIVNAGTLFPQINQDNESIIALVQQVQAAMVVVGPEAPLVDGLVDAMAKACPTVLCFGPTQAAAQLEASKAFSKDFLQQQGIPTASYRNFTNVQEALAYVESLDENERVVVKASGLAAGKGVLLPTNKAETIQAVQEIMTQKAFGAAGDICVIESYLTGPEASCLAFCDGRTAKLMPAAQDHKRALDKDQGLNTGGMGAYAPAPVVTPALHRQIEDFCIRTVQSMAARGTPYVGILYAGMMLTSQGPYVLEFNCRFGDPETQVLLPLLETDLYEIFIACCTGTLDTMDVRFKDHLSAATVVCAAQGYPEAYPKGMKITGLEAASLMDNVKVYHAGTYLDETAAGVGVVTRCNGGRVLAVTGLGKGLKAALTNAYQGVSKIDFVKDSGEQEQKQSLLHRRTDIGKRALEKRLRIGVLGSTRGTALLPVMEACANGSLHAEIVAVLSNKSTAGILEKGKSLGKTVVTKFISARGLSRAEYDAECTATLLSAGVEFVLLVGYMRILSKPFCEFWRGRCINVHPSLLPRHAGGMDLAVHQAVLDAGDKETGCTIHQVTEAVDGGPIVLQKVVKVEEGDTAESLKAKVQPLEGPAFVEAIQIYCRGEVIRYADAGVSIDAGNKLVDMIKPLCKTTRRSGCDAELGGFGGLFDLAAAGFQSENTVLIGATDGVGTKLKIAHLTNNHESVGIDLVAMCVNDLIVAGGEPLFFLDYFATGHLEVEQAAAVVKGIAEGCEQAQCGLIGGETAEMPSMYAPGEYDLAGFSVGAVHRDHILPQNVVVGDVLLGLASSGIHSNGFSLVRKLIEKEGLSYDSPCPWTAATSNAANQNKKTVGEALLTPTKIYVRACLPLLKKRLIKGMAHITGGGLLENLPRSLPDHIAAEITSHPPLPPVFRWIKTASGLDDHEMLRTFNCGVGMVLILAKEHVAEAKALLTSHGERDFFDLGTLVEGPHNVQVKSVLI